LPPTKTDYSENIYWVFGMVLSDEVEFDADEIMVRLANLNVGTRPFFWGMHEQPVFNKMKLFNKERYPVTERISRRGFYIPSGLAITEEQQSYVVEAVKKTLSS
ncbi:MAG: DegT/DnrJ/EryC1/StrS family aminotransferase, partial [Chloroflexota bacterium]